MKTLALMLLLLGPGIAQAGTGTVDVVHADLLNGTALHRIYVRPDTGGRFLVSTKADARFLDGDRVQATRVAAKGTSGPRWTIAPLIQRAARAEPAVVGGTRSLAVVLIAFADSPAPPWMTAAQIRTSIFDAPASVSAWFKAESYGLLTLTGDVYGPYVIPLSYVGCPYASAGSHGRQAMSAQVGAAKLATYQHFLYVFTGNVGCPWAGLSTVGGAPSHSWAGGDSDVIRHELGHALGMWHSHSLMCVKASVCTPGHISDYGDTFDTMGGGSGSNQPFNAVQKATVLGWLGGAGPPITTVTANGAYALDPYETPGTLPKALRVLTPAGDRYYAEQRSTGLLVHLHRGGSNGIYLLDMTADAPDWGRPWLPVGGTFRDPTSDITLTLTAPGRVTVGGLGGPPPVDPPPCPPTCDPPPVGTGTSVSTTFVYKNTGKAQLFVVDVPPYQCRRRTGGASVLEVWKSGQPLGKPVPVPNPDPKGETFTLRCAVDATTVKLYLGGALRLTLAK